MNLPFIKKIQAQHSVNIIINILEKNALANNSQALTVHENIVQNTRSNRLKENMKIQVVINVWSRKKIRKFPIQHSLNKAPRKKHVKVGEIRE